MRCQVHRKLAAAPSLWHILTNRPDLVSRILVLFAKNLSAGENQYEAALLSLKHLLCISVWCFAHNYDPPCIQTDKLITNTKSEPRPFGNAKFVIAFTSTGVSLRFPGPYFRISNCSSVVINTFCWSVFVEVISGFHPDKFSVFW